MIFIEKENPCSFFRFSFRAFLSFYSMNAHVYIDIDQGIYKKNSKMLKRKKEKNYMDFLIHKIQQILKRFAGTFNLLSTNLLFQKNAEVENLM